jgi:hypothetical protein
MTVRLTGFTILAAVLLSGCGYTTDTVWRKDIKTVAVPVFRTRSLRRGHEFELTKAVTEEIMRRSGYTLANNRDADTILLGEINRLRTPVLVEDSQDRIYEYSVNVEMRLVWRDQRTGDVLYEGLVSESGDAVLSRGESLETARDEAFRELARVIVDKLLVNW